MSRVVREQRYANMAVQIEVIAREWERFPYLRPKVDGRYVVIPCDSESEARLAVKMIGRADSDVAHLLVCAYLGIVPARNRFAERFGREVARERGEVYEPGEVFDPQGSLFGEDGEVAA